MTGARSRQYTASTATASPRRCTPARWPSWPSATTSTASTSFRWPTPTPAPTGAALRAASAGSARGAPSRIGDAARLAAEGPLTGRAATRGRTSPSSGWPGRVVQRPPSTRHAPSSPTAPDRARGSWNALQNPREGTILSVLRAWSHSSRWAARAHRGLRRRSGRRPAGRPPRARRDAAPARRPGPPPGGHAGGQGFVYFLEGARLGAHRRGAAAGGAAAGGRRAATVRRAPARRGRHGLAFCAEALVSGVAIDLERLKARGSRWATRWSWPAADRWTALHDHLASS